MKNLGSMFLFTLALAVPMVSQAAVIQTVGSGSAVTTVDALANFENVNALNANPYLEGGLSFSRTGLTFNNNSCGYAGCSWHLGFAGFSGNYMYGTGTDGYFTISTTGTSKFSGLEFVVGTGSSNTSASGQWLALNNSIVVGSGSFNTSVGSTIGFYSASGFDELRYGQLVVNGVGGAPAFDTVRADFVDVQAVPEPVSIALFGLGLAGAATVRRKVAKTK
jgi:hypothetical protein